MIASLILLVLWVIFGVIHSGMSWPTVRGPIVDKIGLLPFKALSSIVALILVVPLLGFFVGHMHSGPVLWNFGDGFIVTLISKLLIFLAIIFYLEALPPVVIPPEIRGSKRVSRHTQMTGFIFFSLGHIISNGHLFDVIGFMGFAVYSMVAAWLQDRKRLDEYGETYRVYMEETSFMPFGAIISGRQKLSLGQFSKIRIVLAFIIFGLVTYKYHTPMIERMETWPLGSEWQLPVKLFLYCHVITGMATVAALVHCLYWAMRFKKGDYRQAETQKKMANVACILMICTVVTGFFMVVPFTTTVQPFLHETGKSFLVKLFQLKFFWGVVACVFCLGAATYRGSFDPEEDHERLGNYIKYTRLLMLVAAFVAMIGLVLTIIKPV